MGRSVRRYRGVGAAHQFEGLIDNFLRGQPVLHEKARERFVDVLSRRPERRPAGGSQRHPGVWRGDERRFGGTEIVGSKLGLGHFRQAEVERDGRLGRTRFATVELGFEFLKERLHFGAARFLQKNPLVFEQSGRILAEAQIGVGKFSGGREAFRLILEPPIRILQDLQRLVVVGVRVGDRF